MGHRLVTARTLDRAAQVVTPVRATFNAPRIPPTWSPPEAFGLNLPLVDPGVAEHVPWIGVFAEPFPAQMGVWQQVPGGTFRLIRTIAKSASVGETLIDLPPGPTNRWHTGGAVNVRFFNTSPSSAMPSDVLSGANALAIEADTGLWEIVQYRDAVLNGDGSYRLSVLLRGQLGTEDATAETIGSGARVVVLDGSLATLPMDLSEIGLVRRYRVGPLADGVGGRNVTSFEFTGTGRGMKPFSPVHGQASRQSDGALEITWVRRTRRGGGRWGAGDVPLGESAESYRLDILDGETVVRSVETPEPSYTYLLADQTADFEGVPPDPLSFRVGQYSPGVMLGTLYEVTVDVQQS